MVQRVGVSREFRNVADRWLKEVQAKDLENNPFALADEITQDFPEINSVAASNQTIPFSPSLTFAGSNNSFRNNQVNAIGKIYVVSGVDDFPDFISLILDLALQSGAGPTDEVELDIFVASMLEGDIFGNGFEDANPFLIPVGNRLTNEYFRTLLAIDTAGIPDDPSLISVGITRDATAGNPADSFTGNVTLVGMTMILPRPGAS